MNMYSPRLATAKKMKKVYSYLANYIVGWNKSESLVLNWSATVEVCDSFNGYVLLLLNVIWNLSNWNHFLLQFSKSKEIYARQYKQWWFWLLFIYFFSEYWITIQLLSGRYSDLVLPQWHRLSDIHVIWNISWFLFQQWLGKRWVLFIISSSWGVRRIGGTFLRKTSQWILFVIISLKEEQSKHNSFRTIFIIFSYILLRPSYVIVFISGHQLRNKKKVGESRILSKYTNFK